MCLQHNKNKQVQEIKKESLIKAWELSSKQMKDLLIKIFGNACTHTFLTPTHQAQHTWKRQGHWHHKTNCVHNKVSESPAPLLSLLCAATTCSLWFLSATRVPADQFDSQNTTHSCNKGTLQPLFYLLAPSSSIENQTTNLIIFTEKTAAGTTAIEKEATKKAILSMIIQPLCSFSTYLFIFFLCHTHLVFLVLFNI
jgi:hypothetical protein